MKSIILLFLMIITLLSLGTTIVSILFKDKNKKNLYELIILTIVGFISSITLLYFID